MKKKAKIKTVGKLVKISDENHALLKLKSAEKGLKMEFITNQAIYEYLKGEK